MLIELSCPTCKAAFRIDDEIAGAEWTCAACGKSFDVTSAKTSTTKPAGYTPLDNSTLQNARTQERLLVSLEVAAWGAVFGICATVAYGLQLPIMRLLFARSDDFESYQLVIQFFVACVFVIVAGCSFGFAFLMGSSLICKSTASFPAASVWGGRSFWMSVVVIASALVSALVLFGTGFGSDVLLPWLSLATIISNLAAHGLLAIGFGAIAKHCGHADVARSSRTYWLLILALAIWGAVTIFLLEVDLDSRIALEPGTANQSSWLGRLVTVIGMVAHLFWFLTIARRTAAAIRKQQIVATLE